MTRMIRETIHSLVESATERRTLEVIRDAPGIDRLICLHSLVLGAIDISLASDQ